MFKPDSFKRNDVSSCKTRINHRTSRSDKNYKFFLLILQLLWLIGIGKTTLVKKICEKLQSKNVEINGFYTEELRDNNSRIGFDVVTLTDGKRTQLARTR